MLQIFDSISLEGYLFFPIIRLIFQTCSQGLPFPLDTPQVPEETGGDIPRLLAHVGTVRDIKANMHADFYADDFKF